MYSYFALATLMDLIYPLVSNAEDTITQFRTTSNERNLESTKASGGKKTKVPKAPKAPKLKKVKGTKAPKKREMQIPRQEREDNYRAQG